MKVKATASFDSKPRKPVSLSFKYPLWLSSALLRYLSRHFLAGPMPAPMPDFPAYDKVKPTSPISAVLYDGLGCGPVRGLSQLRGQSIFLRWAPLPV